jgi:Flp pilus assembly protein TadB
MTTDLALLGLCAGIGVVLVVAGLRSRRTPLSVEMTRYDPNAIIAAGYGGPERTPAGAALVVIGSSIGRFVTTANGRRQQAQDLAVTDRGIERHAVVIATAMMLGVIAPVALVGLMSTIGWHLPAETGVALAAIGAATGIAIPTMQLRRAASRARERFLRALSCWLELVALAQAGGMGVESALEAAGRISPDPAFARIRQVLERARHSGTTPWAEMGRLGGEIGIDELDELAASLGLAGMEGARIRSSLKAKATSLRRRQMSDAQSRANSMTERLFLPSIILMVGFMVFLLYPVGASLANVL